MNVRRTIAHLIDGVASMFARLSIRRSHPTPNTLGELAGYRSHGVEALFGGPAPAPDVRVRKLGTWRGLRWHDLRFASPHEPLEGPFRRLAESAYQRNATAHARWLCHTDGRARPTMVYLHSWMQPAMLVQDAVVLPMLARRLDVDVVRLQLPFHGKRKPASSAFHGEYFWTADLARTFEALRQSVADTRALLSWIEGATRAPVGVMGVSLGGMVTQAVACFDERPAFAVPVAAHLDLAGVLEDAAMLRRMRGELEAHGWGVGHVAEYCADLGLYDMQPRVDPNRMLFVAGRYDRVLHADRITQLWEWWGRPPIHWYDGGHLGIATHLGQTVTRARQFLESLDLVRPTRLAMESSPIAA